MGLVNVKSKKNRIKYEGDFPNGDWEKTEYDKNGNNIYHENSTGYWSKRKYDKEGRLIYYEDSRSYWEKQEYNNKGYQSYYENSIGEIIDKRK